MVRLAAVITVMSALATVAPYAGLAVSHASRTMVVDAHVAHTAVKPNGSSRFVSVGWLTRRVAVVR